jgi:ribosomal protein S12 methylthiotransferase accessory factor
MLYSRRQYEDRREINATGTAFTYVPEPFDDTSFMDWTGIWSISEGRFKLIPSAYLFYNYPQPRGGPYCWADSNGCATGRTLTDAVRRGLYELIERDSVAIWWYNRLRRPGVDLRSFQIEYFDQFIATYSNLQRDVWVLDITADLNIPTFAAVSRSTAGRPEDILVAFGSHLDPRMAIEHALCEMNHLLPAVLLANRDSSGNYPYPDPAQQAWWRAATVDTEPYLLPDLTVPALTADHYSFSNPDSVADQVFRVCNIVERSRLEVLVLNQTRPDINIPVAKVIVPGLRHFWARFAPGRLYDVPVSMGWLKRPYSERELNPIAMFL